MTFRRAIVRPPSATFPDGLTTAGLGPPDLALARAQHAAYVRALEECGLAVTALPADDRFPDSTFVEDTAVLARGLAVLCRPGAPSRAGEVEAIRASVVAAFADVTSIEAPGMFHVYPIIMPWHPDAREALAVIGSFVERQIAASHLQ